MVEAREPGLSARLKLTLSYVGFLLLAGGLLLTAVYAFLLRGYPRSSFVPEPSDFLRVFDRSSFGPRVFVPAALMVLAFLTVFGLVGGWMLAGRMLAPLARITAATRLAATGSLSHRIALDGPQDEFREAADAFDAMLARLEALVAEQQRFAANASHELRTPLAITQTLIDVARTDPQRDTAELLERLRAVNERAIDLTEALLLLSRAEQGLLSTEPVDLSLAVDEAVETLLPLAEQRGVTIETGGDVAIAAGSPTLLLQLTTNLLHNAIVHNLPDQGTVQLTTARTPGAAELMIENTGRPLDPLLVAGLTEPFRRGTERVHDTTAGVGLGLAVVERIVRAHDGTLTLAARPGGGLRLTVALPAPPVESRTRQRIPRRRRA